MKIKRIPCPCGSGRRIQETHILKAASANMVRRRIGSLAAAAASRANGAKGGRPAACHDCQTPGAGVYLVQGWVAHVPTWLKVCGRCRDRRNLPPAEATGEVLHANP